VRGAARVGIGLALLAAAPAAAQLRPLDPFDWRAFDGGRVGVEVGAGWLEGQRASLAGTEGRLVEAGNWRGWWSAGRVAVEAGGTVQRLFRERKRFAEAEPEVRPAEGGRRRDAGDQRILTAVRLTAAGAPVDAVLRFGTRLPTTDNTTGLDRDATDFVATLGARAVRGGWSAQAEAGVGIFGTRRTDFEQDDLLVYALRLERAAGPLVPALTVVGQQVGSGHREIRGNESLAEVRLGFRTSGRRWVAAEGVRGLSPFSPRGGVLVWAGAAW
jgi:hypothetical protein